MKVINPNLLNIIAKLLRYYFHDYDYLYENIHRALKAIVQDQKTMDDISKFCDRYDPFDTVALLFPSQTSLENLHNDYINKFNLKLVYMVKENGCVEVLFSAEEKKDLDAVLKYHYDKHQIEELNDVYELEINE